MRILKNGLILSMLLVTFFSCKKEVKSTNEELNKTEIAYVSNTEFKDLVEDKNVQLVDVRTPVEYKEGHLKNALLINYKDENFVKNAVQKLDKSKPVYVYCHSGHRSANSAKLLKKEGFTVVDMKSGISGWKTQGYQIVSPQEKTEIKITIKEPKVANKEKPVIKYITTNTNSVSEVQQENTQMPVQTTVTQTTNTTSNIVVEEIKEEPISSNQETIVNVEPTVTESTNTVEEVAETITKPVQAKPLSPALIKVNTAEFKQQINGKNVQLVDVRTPKEFNDGHIKNAKNINIYDSDFLSQTNVLDKSKPVYVYCRSGVRSMKAAKKLKNSGYKVYNLNGGILGWKSNGNKVEK